MGIATYPTILTVLLIAAIVFVADAGPAAGAVDAGGGGLPGAEASIAATPAATTAPVLDFETSIGRGWWQVRASAEVMSLAGLPTEWLARIEALGMRAVFQHDAARETPFFVFEFPELSLGGLSRLFRF